MVGAFLRRPEPTVTFPPIESCLSSNTLEPDQKGGTATRLVSMQVQANRVFGIARFKKVKK